MWTHYRKWRHGITPILIAIGLFLMRGEPDGSPRWMIGMALAVAMGLIYITEELFRIFSGKGRPCKHCGRLAPIKSFSLAHKCPACGGALD